MKILPISDLHFEFQADHGKAFVESLSPDYDVVVIAGDMTMHKYGISEALRLFCNKYRNVVFVPGNHEYYASDRGRVNVSLRKAKAHFPNLHVLENDVAEIEGHRFLGTTMWFKRTMMTDLLAPSWSDFLSIHGLFNWVYKQNEEALNFLQLEMKTGDIVVTHHLPSVRSVHEKYKYEQTNCFYVCDVDDLIVRREPALWIHGHTHESNDYVIGKTRVVCNPYGYDKVVIDKHGVETTLLNENFQRNLVVEL
jgi:Icc-related predicted phosphoesterase